MFAFKANRKAYIKAQRHERRHERHILHKEHGSGHSAKYGGLSGIRETAFADTRWTAAKVKAMALHVAFKLTIYWAILITAFIVWCVLAPRGVNYLR